MLKALHMGISTDTTMFKVSKQYFEMERLPIKRGSPPDPSKPPAKRAKSVSATPSWVGNGDIINNASQLQLYPNIFGKDAKGECYAPSVMDAMPNCSRLGTKPKHRQGIDIKVTGGDDDHFIEYKVDINGGNLDLTFKFKNGVDNELSAGPVRVVHNDLSVKNVIGEIVSKFIGLLGAGSIDAKIINLKKKIDDSALIGEDIIGNILLPIFCRKLFGDFGQELFAVSKDMIFAANDVPSAVRYILMKSFATGKRGANGGGGLVTARNYYCV